MSTVRCTIHNVTFRCEPPPDASEEVKQFCQIQECPVCAWQEKNRLQSELARVRKHRDQLLDAFEIKLERLREVVE